MGVLSDLLAVSSQGIKVIDRNSVAFEGFDAMRQNPEVVSNLVPKKLSDFSNWGTDENGKPIMLKD